MKIRVGDTVEVIAGKDKGKQGEVLQVLAKQDKVIVEGVNTVTKHIKPSQADPEGGIFRRGNFPSLRCADGCGERRGCGPAIPPYQRAW